MYLELRRLLFEPPSFSDVGKEALQLFVASRRTTDRPTGRRLRPPPPSEWKNKEGQKSVWTPAGPAAAVLKVRRPKICGNKSNFMCAFAFKNYYQNHRRYVWWRETFLKILIKLCEGKLSSNVLRISLFAWRLLIRPASFLCRTHTKTNLHGMHAYPRQGDTCMLWVNSV